MAKPDKNSITAIILGSVAVISSFINVWNWFFWIFAIIGIYFGIKALRNGEKMFAWIGIGLCALSIVTYALVRYWPESADGDEEVLSEKDERDYQQAVDEANHWDVTEDYSADAVPEQPKEEIKEDSVVEEKPSAEETQSSENGERDNEPATPDDDPENVPIFE